MNADEYRFQPRFITDTTVREKDSEIAEVEIELLKHKEEKHVATCQVKVTSSNASLGVIRRDHNRHQGDRRRGPLNLLEPFPADELDSVDYVHVGLALQKLRSMDIDEILRSPNTINVDVESMFMKGIKQHFFN